MKVPEWYASEFERSDNRQFQIGEMVKVQKDARPKNDTCMDLEYHYYIVFDDGRGKKHRTYTYGLDRIHPSICDNEMGERRVYGYYPKDIEPCTEAEKVLYYSKSVLHECINGKIKAKSST